MIRSLPKLVKSVFFTLVFIEMILLIAYFFPESWSATIYDRISLDREANIPTWFSTILLLLVSVSSFIIYLLHSETNKDKWPKFWLVFSLVYCFLSIDEGARMHEIFMDRFNLKWIYVYAPISFMFFAYTAWFLIKVNNNKRLALFIVGGLIIYASGGLGCETIYFFFYQGKSEVMVEEGFEMLGSITVLTGTLLEISESHNNLFKRIS